MFSQTGSSASLFGGASNQPGLFGASSAASGGLFGAPASGGLFGAQAASSSSLFGTTASSAGLFGAASSGGLFGASSQPSTGLFGASAGAGAPASGGLFGTPASSSGLFGTPASSASLFGTPASSGGLFGATSTPGPFGAPASSAGLFGATSSPSLFGGGASTGALQLFGGNTGAMQQYGAPAQAQQDGRPAVEPAVLQQLSQEQQTLMSSIKEFDECLTPGSTSFKYTKLFLYVVDPAQRTRPPNISESQWRHALAKAGGKDNAQGLWPVAVQGIQQMSVHNEAQVAAAEENAKYMHELTAVAAQLSRHEQETRTRANAVLQKHSMLAHRLLKVVKMVDALEAQTASSLYDATLNLELAALSEKLAQVEAELAPHNVQGLKHSINALASAASVQANVGWGASSSAEGLDEQSLQQAAELFAEHNAGIRELHVHLDKIQRDLSVLDALHREPEMMYLN